MYKYYFHMHLKLFIETKVISIAFVPDLHATV